ncbi:hypothetical protein GYMLUDRAFT_84479 [Collybiopsis luxurians FD-317 M1]|uniref:Uncharacterized protein n=1 Tax=Collybiopsis luxurians FD-317 M1 TaxID=944289 RepID=A0A0D0C3A8_9AGAR|nr:hypothetical protein GYMLUDRAFT_84479 [Collybiopsis luxurians FD-317 M1]
MSSSESSPPPDIGDDSYLDNLPSATLSLASEPLSEPDMCNCHPGEEHSCWEVDYEVYGVIHSPCVGCPTCDSFASHIHQSREQGVRGIEEAYARMHERHDTLWRRGLVEGERREAHARRAAFEQLNVTQIAHAKVDEELKALTEVFLGKDSVENFLSMFTTPKFGSREEFQARADRNFPLWNDSMVAASQAHKIPDKREEVSVGGDHSLPHALPLSPKSSSRSVLTNGASQPTTYFDRGSTVQEPRHALPPRPLTSPESASIKDVPQLSIRASYAEAARSFSSVPPLISPGLSSQPTSTASSLPTPNSVRPGSDIPGYYSSISSDNAIWNALSVLFVAAHSGDAAALAKCKALATEAHATPANEKTYGQRLVLMQWRNPQPPESSAASSSSSVVARHSRRRSQRGRGDSSDPGLKNPKATDPPEMWFEYLQTHSTSWPNGVRRQSNGDPNLADLRAARIHAQVRPVGPPQYPSTYRAAFVVAVLTLFTNKGRYRTLVQQLGLRIPPVPRYYPYPGTGGTIDLTNTTISEEDVARHYATCGVTVKEAEDFIEDWAIQFKGEKEGKKERQSMV